MNSYFWHQLISYSSFSSWQKKGCQNDESTQTCKNIYNNAQRQIGKLPIFRFLFAKRLSGQATFTTIYNHPHQQIGKLHKNVIKLFQKKKREFEIEKGHKKLSKEENNILPLHKNLLLCFWHSSLPIPTIENLRKFFNSFNNWNLIFLQIS